MTQPIECEYHGAIWGGTGYSEAARNAVLALNAAGVRVKVDPSGFAKGTITVGNNIITIKRHEVNRGLKFPLEFRTLIEQLRYKPIDKESPLVIHAPSPRWGELMDPRRRTIGYTAWETAMMPQNWVDGCNMVDEVWIPSFHNRDVLKRSDVEVPIYVVPHPIDTERFSPAKIRLNGTFTFISVFRWGLRKGWPELFTAYEQAFNSSCDVILRVLTNYRSDEHRAQAQAIIEHFRQRGKPQVEILPLEFVPYDFMPILYQNADAFVLPSRGEGFCLPCAEAMACGLPAIVTNATAFLDYVDKNNGYPVSFRTEEAEDSSDPDRDATTWVVADIEDLSNQMLQAWSDAGELRRRGTNARATIESKFSYKRVADTMIRRLDADD